MLKVYARLEDDVSVEYPVYPIHLVTRGHTPDMYSELTFGVRPVADRFQSIQEKLTVTEGNDAARELYAFGCLRGGE